MRDSGTMRNQDFTVFPDLTKSILLFTEPLSGHWLYASVSREIIFLEGSYRHYFCYTMIQIFIHVYLPTHRR